MSAVALFSLILGWSAPSLATSRFQVTEAEKLACGGDAYSLCSEAFPDQDKLLACMRLNRTSLTSGCRTALDAGLRRRGIQ